MADPPIDYEAAAKQFGGTSVPAPVDYSTIAKQFGGTSSGDAGLGQSAPERALGLPGIPKPVTPLTAKSTLADTATDIATAPERFTRGVLKGGASTVVGVGSLLSHIPGLESLAPSPSTEEFLKPADTAEAVGKGAEQTTEFFAPAGLIGKAGKAVEAAAAGTKLARAAPIATRAALQGISAGGITAAQTRSPKTGAIAGAITAPVSAALEAALPLAGRLNPQEESALASVQGKVPISAGQELGNPALERVEQGLENIPGSAGRAQDFYRTQQAALASRAGEVATQATPGAVPGTGEYQAGQAVPQKLKSLIAAGKQKADTLYGEVRQAYEGAGKEIQTGIRETGDVDNPVVPVMEKFAAPVNVGEFKTGLRPVYEELSQTMPEAKRLYSRSYQALKQLMDGPDLVDAATMDRNLGAIKAIAREGPSPYLNTQSQGLAKKMIGGMEDVFQKSLTENLGPDILPKLMEARNTVHAYHVLDDMLTDLPPEPAQVYATLTRGGDKVYDQLSSLRQVAPDEMKQVGRTFLDGLIQKATAEGGFRRGAGIMADWQRMGPKTKQLLFGGSAQDLDNFFLAAKRLTVDRNPSGTAKMLAALGPVGAAMDAAFGPGTAEEKMKRIPLEVGGTMAFANILSRLLLTPGGARLLTTALTPRAGSVGGAAIGSATKALTPPQSGATPAFAKGAVVDPLPTGPGLPPKFKAQPDQDLITGSSSVPLTLGGDLDARKVGAGLSRKGGLDKLIVSGAERARESAEALRSPKATGSVVTDEAFNPWAEGRYEGLPEPQAEPALLQFALKQPDTPPPGVGPLSTKPGESFNQFRARVLGGLQKVMQQLLQNPGARIGILTHSVDLGLIQSWVKMGMKPDLSVDPRRIFESGTKPGDVFRFWPVDAKGTRWQLDKVNLGSPGRLRWGIYPIRHAQSVWDKNPKGEPSARLAEK